MPFSAALGARAIDWCREHGLWGHAVIRDDLRFDHRDPHVRQYEIWLQGEARKRLGTVPDLVVVLDLPDREVEVRRAGRGTGDRLEREDDGFHATEARGLNCP